MTDNAKHPSPLDPEYLDGHTIESLSDYLDRGRRPTDSSIESSPGAQNALAALSRLRVIAPRVLVADADRFRPSTDHWIKRILDQIGVQAHAGREIPLSHDVPSAALSITEGAVRAIVRTIGDELDGMLVERVRLDGDVETAGADVTVTVEISTFEGADLQGISETLRQGIRSELVRHTELVLADVVLTVRDTDLSEDDEESR